MNLMIDEFSRSVCGNARTVIERPFAVVNLYSIIWISLYLRVVQFLKVLNIVNAEIEGFQVPEVANTFQEVYLNKTDLVSNQTTNPKTIYEQLSSETQYLL